MKASSLQLTLLDTVPIEVSRTSLLSARFAATSSCLESMIIFSSLPGIFARIFPPIESCMSDGMRVEVELSSEME